VKPNTTIAEALSVFCKKFGLQEDGWTVTTSQRKELDLSLTFRLSGLTSNAKLTLSKKIGAQVQEVSIALQTSKERYIGKFLPSVTLWDILKHWENEKGLNLTNDADIFPESKDNTKVYMQPVITYTTKEIGTNEDLRGMTLSKLGLTSGTGLLRLCHKYTTIPIEVFLSMDAQNASLQEMARAQEQKIQQEKIELQEKEKAEKMRIEKELIENEKIIELEKSEKSRIVMEEAEKIRIEQERVRQLKMDQENSEKRQREKERVEKLQREREKKFFFRTPRYG